MIEYVTLIAFGVIVATIVMRGLSKKFRPLILFYNVAGVFLGSSFLLLDGGVLTFTFHLWATMIPFFLLMLLMGLISS
ncbi:MAG: hypothetical protein QXO32_06790 [Candidatus Bathyarchaeia archaeon]